MSVTQKRKLYFDPVTGGLRFDKDYSMPVSIPASIPWPMEEQRQNKKYGFKNLTLTLTMKCDLACDYCWQYRGDMPDIEKETIDRWLDFFLDEENNFPGKVLYYGGEPLLRVDLIEYASSIIRKLCGERGIPPVKQHIFTNATLLTDENLDVLQREKVFLILSIDGNPRINALHRHTARGEPVNDLIFQGVERLHRRGMKFGVCCTLSEVEFDPSCTIKYILDVICPDSIELNLRHDIAFCEEAKKYANCELHSFYASWDIIRANNVINIDLHKRVAAVAARVPLQNSSSGSKNKLSVMPNGMISSFNGAVSFPELQFTPVGNWIVYFKKRWSRNVLTAPKCRQCRAAYICGQGSAFSSYLQYGDFQHTPALHCEYCNTMFQYILETIRKDLLSRRTIPYGYEVMEDDIYHAFPELFSTYESQ